MKIVKAIRPQEQIYGQNLQILTALRTVISHFCTDEVEIGQGEPAPDFTFIGATCSSSGRKTHFWTRVKEIASWCPAGSPSLRLSRRRQWDRRVRLYISGKSSHTDLNAVYNEMWAAGFSSNRWLEDALYYQTVTRRCLLVAILSLRRRCVWTADSSTHGLKSAVNTLLRLYRACDQHIIGVARFLWLGVHISEARLYLSS